MKNYSTEQSGRSMIEMLGVLAIVGVLSVAGIAGYSKAMAKFKTNKLVDQITSLSSSVRTMFSGAGTYAGLNTTSAYNLGLIPEDATKTCGSTFSTGCVIHALNGSLDVQAATTTNTNDTFKITISNLTRDACASLAASDWGGPTSVALVGAGGAGSVTKTVSAGANPIETAAACSCGAGTGCVVAITYY